MKMKKASIFCLLLASMLLSFSCQKKESVKGYSGNSLPNSKSASMMSAPDSTQEEVRIVLAKGMVNFKNALKDVYEKSSTYEDFKRILFNEPDHKMSAAADSLLHGAYLLLENKIPDQYIIAHYGGTEMARATLFLADNPDSDGAAFFNFTPPRGPQVLKCKWYQIGCLVNAALNWIEGHKKQLETAIKLAGDVAKLIRAW